MAATKQIVLEFIKRINEHDVDGIMQLLSSDYQFVNAAGERFSDRNFIRDTWRAQFKNHPDYHIRAQHVLADGDAVGVFGVSSGTYAPDGEMRDEDKWEVPSAFLVMSRDGLVTYFESFADASIVFNVMKARAE